MTPLDQALKNLQDDPESIENRHHFYSLFLQTDFFVPIFDQENGGMAKGAGEPNDPKQALPLIMESDGANFMMLFDQAAHLQGFFELGFTPASAFLRIPLERISQVLRIATDLETDFEYFLDFTFEQGVALDRLAVHIVDALLEALDLFAERFQQRFQ